MDFSRVRPHDPLDLLEVHIRRVRWKTLWILKLFDPVALLRSPHFSSVCGCRTKTLTSQDSSEPVLTRLHPFELRSPEPTLGDAS